MTAVMTEPDYTQPGWWDQVPSVDGVPDALTRDADNTPDAEGEKFLADLERYLTEQAPQARAFVAPLATTRVRKPACVRVKWRGVIVCSHSVPKLNAWAVSTGQSILLWPLAGCGSYQTTTKASAGTHAGGGAIDINANPHTPAQRTFVAQKARQVGLQVGWFRGYIKGLWTNHYHVLDPDCPQLSSAAVSQCIDCIDRNDNGLVGTARDTGWRGNIAQLKAIFTERLWQTIAVTAPDIATAVTAAAEAAKVKNLLTAVRQPQTGYWDIDADIDLRNTRAEATSSKFTGAYFRKWTSAQRIRMQRSWGCKTLDGLWGPQTKAAAIATTKQIQRGLGLTADGVWGPVTDKAYTELGAKYRRNYYINRPVGAFPVPGRAGSLYGPSTAGKAWYSGKSAGTLTVSQIRWQIKRIQRMVGGTTVDGLYGSGTTARVKAWQKAHRLTVDGLVGPQTWAAMGKANHA